MNDKQYNDFIKNQLKENEEDYFSDIEQNKDRTWSLIELQLNRKRIIPLWLYYAAASIIMFISLGFVFKHEMNSKNKEINMLTSEITKLQLQKSMVKEQIVVRIDTVTLSNNKLVYVPVKKLNTIIRHDTIVKTITQIDTVFIKEKLPELIAEEEKAKSVNIVPDEVILANNHSKKRKKKRFIFRFGSNFSSSGKQKQNESLISFKSK